MPLVLTKAKSNIADIKALFVTHPSLGVLLDPRGRAHGAPKVLHKCHKLQFICPSPSKLCSTTTSNGTIMPGNTGTNKFPRKTGKLTKPTKADPQRRQKSLCAHRSLCEGHELHSPLHASGQRPPQQTPNSASSTSTFPAAEDIEYECTAHDERQGQAYLDVAALGKGAVVWRRKFDRYTIEPGSRTPGQIKPSLEWLVGPWFLFKTRNTSWGTPGKRANPYRRACVVKKRHGACDCCP